MAITQRPGPRSRRSVELVIDVSQKEIDFLLMDLRKHVPSKVNEAKTAAVVRTAKTAKSRVSTLIRKETTLKKYPVDRRLMLKRLPAKGSEDPTATLEVSGRKISLYLFAGRPKEPPNQRGQSVYKRSKRDRAGWRVWKGEKLARHKFHFVQRSKKGKGPYIMVRSPDARGGRGAKAPTDYRIKYGPSLVEIMERRGLFNQAQIDLTETLRKNLLSQVDRFVKPYLAKRGYKAILEKADNG